MHSFPLFVRFFLSLFILILLAPPQALPQAPGVRYAKPGLTIPVRQDSRNNAEIKAWLPMDVQVSLLRQDGDWARIRLANGTEGWVRSRDLGEKPVLPPELLKPKEGGRKDIPPIQNIQNQFRQMEGDNKHLTQELETCSTELKGLRSRHDALIADPNSMYQLKKSLTAAELQISELQKQLEAAQIENEVLKKNETIKWFLAGGGVLLLGWLIGRLSAASGRKKKSSLL